MKPFIFKLQTSLDIKEKQEEQQKMELQRINILLLENIEILKDLELRLSNLQNEIRRCHNTSGELDISEIKKCQDYIPFLKEKINNQIEVVHMIEIELEKAREVLIGISREKKILENLKIKHFEEYKIEINREEQKAIDEMATNIYIRRELAIN